MKKVVAFMGIALALTGCQREGIPPPPPAPKAAVAASDSPMLKLVPGTLSVCQPGSVVTASWDASSVPGTTAVQLWVADSTGEKLFAGGAAVGSAATGEWATPGMRFLLKSADGSTVVAEATVGGPGC